MQLNGEVYHLQSKARAFDTSFVINNIKINLYGDKGHAISKVNKQLSFHHFAQQRQLWCHITF